MIEPPFAHDLAGVIHCHSTHSDGTGTVPEIAAAARAAGLDYLLLTDHDTLAAADLGEEGWYGSVLLLVGFEVSPRRQNHYLAFGLERPIDHRDLTPQQIVDRVNEAGGFGFLAHPFSKGSERFKRAGEGMPWRDLDADGYTGIELWSFVTDSAERVNSIARAVVVHRRARARSSTIRRARNLDEWDRLCARRRCVALGGVDAHQVGIRVARPRAAAADGVQALVPIPAHASAGRAGAAARARRRPRSGVRRAARGPRVHRRGLARAGARLPVLGRGRRRALRWATRRAGGDWTLRARTPAPARMRLLRDGAEVAAAQRRRDSSIAPTSPGVYRVEAYRDARGRERTWILSNPIYLR